jgi:hypothetical protein
MLRAFAQLGADRFMSVEQAQKYDQRPFRSMLIRKWIEYQPQRGFYITVTGLAAWQEFRSTEIWRVDPTLPLTRYFDPDAYGLRIAKRQPKRSTVHAMRQAGAA